jgi:hypothetical protein
MPVEREKGSQRVWQQKTPISLLVIYSGIHYERRKKDNGEK